MFELSLLLLALLWQRVFDRPILAQFAWAPRDLAIGLAAALPPFLFFLWTLRTTLPSFATHRRLVESIMRPLFLNWSVFQLAVISLIAGIAEEALFRAAIQGSLAERVGSIPGLVLASLAFGAAHLITWTYAIVVCVIGAYLGWLYLATGNLVAPAVTHAVYDFAALWYLVAVYRPTDQAPPE